MDGSDWPPPVASVEARRLARRQAALLVTMAPFVQTHTNNIPQAEEEMPASGAARLFMGENQKKKKNQEREGESECLL